MAGDTVDIKLNVTGEEQVAAAISDLTRRLDLLQKELGQTSRAQTEAASTQKALAAGSGAVVQSLGKFQASAGIVGQSIGRFSAAGGAATQVLGQTLGAVTGLGASFGPLGIALGAGVGAVGALSVGLRELQTEFEKSSEEQNKFVREFLAGWRQGGPIDSSLNNFKDSAAKALGFDGGWLQFTEAASDAARDLGVAIKIMVDDAVQRLTIFVQTVNGVTQALANGNFNQATAFVNAGVAANNSILSSQLARIQAGQDAADREEVLRDFLGNRNPWKPPPTPPPRRGRGRREADPNNASVDWDSFNPVQRGEGDVIGSSAGATELERIDMNQVNEEAGQRLLKIKEESIKLDQQAAMLREQELDDMHKKIELAGQLAGMFGTVLVDSFEQAISGQKNFIKAVVAGFKSMLFGLAKSEFVLSLSELAKGLAAASNPITAAEAPGHFAAAKWHASAAAIAGVAGGVIAGASSIGGGSGGGGGSGSRASSSPTRSGTSATQSSNAGPVIVQFGAPVITATTLADLGLQIFKATQAAQSRYGST